jgi:hypothetical protein
MKKRILTLALTLALVLALIPTTTASFFNDVNTVTGERLEMLEYVAERGLFQGDGGRFNPFDRITNMQFITVMSRMANSGIQDGNPWYQPHLDWAAGIGIAGFDREAFLTRDNMALWFYKYVLSTGITPEVVRNDTPAFTDIGGLSEDYQEAILAMYEWGITVGTTDGIVFGLGNAERIAIAVIIGRFVSRNMPDIPVLPPPPAPAVAGNTQGNLANGGSAAIQGDWIYYANNKGELHKMRTDGTGRIKLTDNITGSINIAGDWIYLMGLINPDVDYLVSTFRIRTDGTEKSRVENFIELDGRRIFNWGSTRIVGEWGYWTHELQGEIFRAPVNGTSGLETVVSCDGYFCLNLVGVVGDTVYYVHIEAGHHDDNWDDHPPKLYKISAGDKEGTVVAVDVEWRTAPVIDGDWVYYLDLNDNLHRVRTDGTGKSAFNMQVGSFNVSGGWIYYVTKSVHPNDPNTGFMKMRTDGTGATRLYNDFVEGINIVGDWIFFGSRGTSYQMRTDGSGLREV